MLGTGENLARLAILFLLLKLKIFSLEGMNINIDLLREKRKVISIIYVTGVGVILGQGLFRYPEMSKP
jgi:hypothetical protein